MKNNIWSLSFAGFLAFGGLVWSGVAAFNYDNSDLWFLGNLMVFLHLIFLILLCGRIESDQGGKSG